MADVFLSYSHRDLPIAERLRRQLQDAGVDTFWDGDIPPGAPLRESVSSAIAAAKLFVLIHPGQYGSSDFMGMETQAAIARSVAGDMQLIPLLMPGRTPEFDIGAFRYLHIKDEDDFGPVVRMIVGALTPASKAERSPDDRRLSLFWSLLESDLERAPQAAALVLDEIVSSLRGGATDRESEIDLLYRASFWAERSLGSEHRSFVALRYQLSAALLEAARYDESVALSRQILARASTPQAMLEVGLQLGYALFQSGRLDDALDQYLAVLEMAQRNDSPSVLTTCLVALGSIARASGDNARAERSFKQALEVSARFVQPSARVSALIGLSEIAVQTGNPQDAINWATEAVWLSRTTLPPDDALTLRATALARSEGDK